VRKSSVSRVTSRGWNSGARSQRFGQY